MRVERIVDHEARFDATGIDSHGKHHHLTHHSVFIQDAPHETMPYVRVRPKSGDTSYYYSTRVAKTQIVLHFTMGYLRGDIATLTTHDYHVSVPFVIGRNGTIYNLFFSGNWAYHLGRGAVGGNTTRSKATIGIELSNIGPLIETGDALHTYYTDPYCQLTQVEHYQSVSYRGFDFFARFTDAQYEALALLLRYLTARYDVPRQFLDPADRFRTDRAVVDFKGIVSHVNYRSSGKVDIGPGFDWDRLISAVGA